MPDRREDNPYLARARALLLTPQTWQWYEGSGASGRSGRRRGGGRSPVGRLARTLRRTLPRRTVASLGAAWQETTIKGTSVLHDPLQFQRPAYQRHCPVCQYRGRFWSFGAPPRGDALCPNCFSLERHRLFQLLLNRYAAAWLRGRCILHFAPEDWVRRRLAAIATYLTADISGHGVDYQCAIESMPFPNDSVDVIMANHVLEHVDDDERAFREIRRVIKPDGRAILSVPLIHGWKTTYENPNIRAPRDRRAHFGQEDHKRVYGRDFADRLRRAGFAVEVFQVVPADEVRFGLRRGEQMFIARPKAETS